MKTVSSKAQQPVDIYLNFRVCFVLMRAILLGWIIEIIIVHLKDFLEEGNHSVWALIAVSIKIRACTYISVIEMSKFQAYIFETQIWLLSNQLISEQNLWLIRRKVVCHCKKYIAQQINNTLESSIYIYITRVKLNYLKFSEEKVQFNKKIATIWHLRKMRRTSNKNVDKKATYVGVNCRMCD